jgi:hypothetical protein
MLVIENQQYFDEVVTFAKKIDLYDKNKDNAALESRLNYLGTYGGKDGDGADKTRVRLFRDFAPYSFSFVIESKDTTGTWSTWFNGGLIYHGPHDGNGSGSAPTFAVTLSPTLGWSIHT